MGATGRDLHADKPLSNMALGYRPSGFIADMIFPVVTVQKQSDTYYVFSRADRLRRQDTARAPGTEAKRIEQNVSSDTYFAKNYALKAAVTLEDRANADPILLNQLITGRAQFVLDSLLIDYEVRVASQVNSTSNVGSSSAVSSAWNGSGDVLGDLHTAINNVHYATGTRPNRVVMGLEAWESARKDLTARNVINGTDNGGGYVTRQQLANLLEVDMVEVGASFQNTGDEGLAESLSLIWGDNVLVYYAPTGPRIDAPSFGYSMRWAAPGLPQMAVERHPFNTRTKSEEVEVGYYQAEKICSAEHAFLLTAVNSST